tara:strand:- start:2073 stop:2633 length:561 start_codon:yes stop_codon:yes gene_type:complete
VTPCLARHWVTKITSRAVEESQSITADELTSVMQQEQAELRHQYLLEIASCTVALIDTKTRTLDLLSIGDCQAGFQLEAGSFNWLTTCHSLSNQIPSCGTKNINAGCHDHVVTRCINAKRFIAPDIYNFTLPQNAQFVLATDGYWREHLENKVPLDQVSDDASALTLDFGVSPSAAATEADNLFLY